MEDFFLKIIMISIYAGALILIVMILRQLFRKSPRNMFLLLWGIVLIRLLCPVSFDNVFSFIPEPTETVQTIVDSSQSSDIQYTEQADDESESTQTVSMETIEEDSNSDTEVQNISILKVVFYIWILGIMVGIVYSIAVYIRLKRRLRYSVKMDGYYLCDSLGQPCVVGFIHSKIYVPANTNKSSLSYILAHESSHIKRRDIYIKLLWYITCLIYWFNPLVWLAFYFMSSDMEQACDETTVRKFNIKEKMEYAKVLLEYSMTKENKSGAVLCLVNGSLKNRIKNLKKNTVTKKKYMVLGICGCVAITICMGFGYQPATETENTVAVSESNDTGEDEETIYSSLLEGVSASDVTEIDFNYSDSGDDSYTIIDSDIINTILIYVQSVSITAVTDLETGDNGRTLTFITSDGTQYTIELMDDYIIYSGIQYTLDGFSGDDYCKLDNSIMKMFMEYLEENDGSLYKKLINQGYDEYTE